MSTKPQKVLPFMVPKQTTMQTAADRIRRIGAAGLSREELLACLGGPRLAEVLSGRLIDAVNADYQTLREQDVDDEDAILFLACVEFARRLARERLPRRTLLERPDKAANYLTLRYGRADQEVVGALFLDTRNRLIADEDLFRGTLDRALIDPRPFLRRALELNAAGLVMFHTHPSGDPAPSAEDLQFTRRLSDAADLLGLKLHDHLILGLGGRWVSLKRRGAW